MSAIEAMRLPAAVDLGEFVGLLRRLNVPFRVSEEAGEQVLWVPNSQLAEQVRSLYQRYPQATRSSPCRPNPSAAGRGSCSN